MSADATTNLHELMPLTATLGFSVERWEPEAVPLRAGRSLIVVETEVRGADSRLAAKVTQSQMVLSQ